MRVRAREHLERPDETLTVGHLALVHVHHVQVILDRWPAWLVHPRRRCCRAAAAAAAAATAAATTTTTATTAAIPATTISAAVSAISAAVVPTAVSATVNAAASRGGRWRVIGREEARALAEPVEEVGRVVRRRESAVARGVRLGVARGNMSDAARGRQQRCHMGPGQLRRSSGVRRGLRPRQQAVPPSKASL